MFEAADEVLDLARAEFGRRIIQGSGPAEGRLRAEKPPPGRGEIAPEQVEGPGEDAGGANQPVGFLRMEPRFLSATGQGPGRHADQMSGRLLVEAGIPEELIPGPIREPFPDPTQQGGRVLRGSPSRRIYGWAPGPTGAFAGALPVRCVFATAFAIVSASPATRPFLAIWKDFGCQTASVKRRLPPRRLSPRASPRIRSRLPVAW